MPRRVLIVSPHFPPINAPDHQRVRMALPYLEENGWEASVLAVRPERVEGVLDPLLDRTLPEGLEVERVGGIPAELTRKLGIGSLALRTSGSLGRAGRRLLQTGRFDLVLFSTTIFPTMSHGPRWKRQFGTPYVLDFQDPWLSDYYGRPGAGPPPGGKLKYGLSRAVARRMEPRAVREAAHIVSVSPGYPEILRGRYPHVEAERFTVLPFGAPERDFELLADLNVPNDICDTQDNRRHWVYVGRGGEDMHQALRSLFEALRRLRDDRGDLASRLRLHFVGTSYARGGSGRPTIAPLAREMGVADLVEERTDRVAYFQALRLLRDADAVLLIGSDDPNYTASKLYPCVLARRPLLAVVHENSSVGRIMTECRAGDCIGFASGDAPAAHADRILDVLRRLMDSEKAVVPETDWGAFAPYTARSMTERLCESFDRALAYSSAR